MTQPATRSRLMSLLSEACELEHGLACSNLYAAFSLKQGTDEGGLDWSQLQQTRLWAAQIYFVASQEMLHLAQVWNLIAAIGGSPYYFRPNFPQKSAYYGFHLPLILQPFGEPCVKRFIAYETPADRLRGGSRVARDSDPDAPVAFRTIGGLYAQVRDIVSAIPEAELFLAGRGQIGPEIVDFPDLIAVRDRASALAAVEAITEQGEGIPKDRADCHYGIFRNIHEQLAEALRKDPSFAPARNVLTSPVPRLRDDWQAGGKVTAITDPFARAAAELFDDVYVLMLRLLQHVFAEGPQASTAPSFARAAIALMPAVLKPLGEATMLLPSGRGGAGKGGAGKGGKTRAGPAFGLSRHVVLPSDEAVARLVAKERALELGATAARLAQDSGAPAQLRSAAANLGRIAATAFEDGAVFEARGSAAAGRT